MRIRTWAHDIEITPNLFSITAVNLQDYLSKLECNNDKGKPIPLTQKFTVKEIKEKLATVERKVFCITDTDDSQLLEMVSWLNSCRFRYEQISSTEEEAIRTDMYSFNGSRYDDLMVAAFLMNYNRFDNTKLLIKHLYETSKEIIRSQRDGFDYKNYFMNSIRKYKLPYTTVDTMTLFALNKASTFIDKQGNRISVPKSLKQTSINLQWYDIIEFTLPRSEEEDSHYGKDYAYPEDEFDRYVIPKYVPIMMDYNINDVFIVCEMVRLNIDEVRLRYSLSSAYKINLLSAARSTISDQLFIKLYSEFSGLHPDAFTKLTTERHSLNFNKIIFPVVKFKTDYMQRFLEDIRKVSIRRTNKEEFCKEVELYGTVYTMAAGGIHSKDRPRLLKSTDDYIYRHYDIKIPVS